MQDKKVTTLIASYLKAKQDEEEAERIRVELGEQICALLGHADEGSKTIEVGSYKIQVTNVIIRSVNWDAFDTTMKELSLEHPPEKEPKRQLDITGLKWIQEHNETAYRALSKAITSKPGRAQLTIKHKE